ncbi:type II toxin-antitoxin system RatA family toxin [Selenihalanaerobacter shriftii]|uniref:Ribosome association toxin PasT (RatA) of the RatAB toxin-antitoxin module n=1 Tax=Selenihalanaerobacter shriftii TaxID=142842 RepID=A0A1T4PB49_9FIRM|nr:aromatase/cyclase [Selenihalanaerobacter shriftii]SJZ88732.1 Ribosome association toxin PasT (RatA) of the RatAB toxin-antitoxin module [Selenihalanaerobacter shriftii]
MPYVESSILINGSVEEVYEIAKEMERYPQFMEDVISVDVINREENTTITAWVTDIDGKKIVWKERDIFDFDNKVIHYEQIEGDLKEFTGEWRFTPINDATKVVLTVDFEFGIPMIAPLLNPVLKKKVISNSEAMLSAIKSEIEREDPTTKCS